MLNNIKGVGFDLDGTLMNTLPGLNAAVESMLKSVGLPVPGEEVVSTWIGNGASVLVEKALNWAGATPSPVELEGFRSAFDRYYVDTVQEGSQLYPGVLETLEELKRSKLKLAVVTNKPSPFVPRLLRELHVLQYFSTVIGADDVVVRKPHPAPIYLILGKLGIKADELLFAGDSRNDIEAAKAAGCKTAGFSYGYNFGEPIAHSNPDLILDKFGDILPILGLTQSNQSE